jgi:hypothetical protein
VGKNRATGAGQGGRIAKIHANAVGKGQLLSLRMSGGQVHPHRSRSDTEHTSVAAAVTAQTRPATAKKGGSRTRTKAPCRLSRIAAPPPRRLVAANACAGDDDTKIENYLCRIKDWRRIVTRYGKLAGNFLAGGTLAGAPCGIKNCEPRSW